MGVPGVQRPVPRKEYGFELLKNYPSERRFLIKKPMEKTIFDTLAQMIAGRK